MSFPTRAFRCQQNHSKLIAITFVNQFPLDRLELAGIAISSLFLLAELLAIKNRQLELPESKYIPKSTMNRKSKSRIGISAELCQYLDYKYSLICNFLHTPLFEKIGGAV
jgi:hypothetical protein